MKNLSRVEVKKAFQEIVSLYGVPKKGHLRCVDQLIAEIVNRLSAYDEVSIIYENGEFHVSTGLALRAVFSPDYRYFGLVRACEWFTDEQLRALHELAFGYQF